MTSPTFDRNLKSINIVHGNNTVNSNENIQSDVLKVVIDI